MRDEIWRELTLEDRIAFTFGDMKLDSLSDQVKRDDVRRDAQRTKKSQDGTLAELAEALEQITILEKANRELQALIDQMGAAKTDLDSKEGKGNPDG